MTTPPAGPQPPNPSHYSHDAQTQRAAAPPNATGPDSARQGLPGWAWAFLGGLIVIAVVVAGVTIAGRNHATPTPVPSGNTVGPAPTPTTTTPEPTVSPTSGPTQIGDWSVEVLEYKPDVTEHLTTYDPPVEITIEGHRYLGIKLRVTNTGDRADPYVDVGVRLDGYTNGHKLHEPYYFEVGTRYRGDDYLLKLPPLEPGESGEGWLFYQVRGDFELTTIEMQDTRDPNNKTPWTEVPYPAPTETTSTPTTTP
ncbi:MULTISPECIES: hypothetical protein [unclassified Actinobaculum]|uniref:hypothetical protein n=1 Tax=unclassified Actinobaculum TaxID=2609299 RepID=UPI000D526806|nr:MULTISPECIES: hypothetical protein [unclassified Actinobaculum]AWE43121.1 hypothetical protein DDD63_10630 [Actinobaculum sp. 313]RTE47622.1 hypothetical protein EKN07_12365 [Actinobaculum sp. 352]